MLAHVTHATQTPFSFVLSLHISSLSQPLPSRLPGQDTLQFKGAIKTTRHPSVFSHSNTRNSTKRNLGGLDKQSTTLFHSTYLFPLFLHSFSLTLHSTHSQYSTPTPRHTKAYDARVRVSNLKLRGRSPDQAQARNLRPLLDHPTQEQSLLRIILTSDNFLVYFSE